MDQQAIEQAIAKLRYALMQLYDSMGTSNTEQAASALRSMWSEVWAAEASIAALQGNFPSVPLPVSSGGTGQVTRQAAVNALAGSQTAGSYLRGDGVNVSMTAIQSADVPVLSGSLLRAPTVYNPGTTATMFTSSGTLTAVSSASINTGPFTAPVSGKVIVTANAVVTTDASVLYMFGLCAHGTTSPVVGNTITLNNPTINLYLYQELVFVVTGLTAGVSYNFDLMFASSALYGGNVSVVAGGATSTLTSLPEAGPVIMRVQAL